MKRFANEKEGLGKKPGLDRGGQGSHQDKKSHEFGGFGTANGNGYANPMEAARSGHPGAIALLQSGGGSLVRKGPRPVPGHLVVKAQRLLGADLSGVTLEEDPALAEQGKRGVAEDGQRIRLIPGGMRDMELIWHELVHIVQQRKAKDGGGAGAESETSGPADGPDVSEPDGAKVSKAEPEAGQVDPEQEAKAKGAALANDTAVQIVGEATGPMYSDEAGDSVSSQPPESSSESGTICEPPNHSEGVENENAESHGEFQGNGSGVVCASGESEEQGAPQESEVKTAVVEVVEIPKDLQAFFDAPSYEFGANGRVLGASPDAESATPKSPAPSHEITASELNQAIATLEGMSAGEREVFLNSTQQRNPASVLFQTELFLETMELREEAESDSYADRAQALVDRAQGQSRFVPWALTYPKAQLSESGSITVTEAEEHYTTALTNFILGTPTGDWIDAPREAARRIYEMGVDGNPLNLYARLKEGEAIVEGLGELFESEEKVLFLANALNQYNPVHVAGMLESKMENAVEEGNYAEAGKLSVDIVMLMVEVAAVLAMVKAGSGKGVGKRGSQGASVAPTGSEAAAGRTAKKPGALDSKKVEKAEVSNGTHLVERSVEAPARKIRGYFGDGTPAFEGNIAPSRLEMIATEKQWSLGSRQSKIDTKTKRVYQERAHVQTSRGEKLVIDTDHTNHGRGDHPAPHYHVYRFQNGSWTKKKSGISTAGQPGLPSISDNIYTGPQPWEPVN